MKHPLDSPFSSCFTIGMEGDTIHAVQGNTEHTYDEQVDHLLIALGRSIGNVPRIREAAGATPACLERRAKAIYDLGVAARELTLAVLLSETASCSQRKDSIVRLRRAVAHARQQLHGLSPDEEELVQAIEIRAQSIEQHSGTLPGKIVQAW